MTQLPDCLLSFSIENYKGIKHAECDGLEDANWVFLTGENGSGKTTVLQVIFYALNINNHNAFHISSKSGIKATFKKFNKKHTNENPNALTYAEYVKPPNLESYNTLMRFGCIAYGPIRLNIQAEETKNEINRKNKSGYGLFFPNATLLNIEYDLLLWKLEKDDKI